MGAFTAIVQGTDLQKVSLLNEIISAYNQRRQAIGQAAIAEVVAGDDIQLQSFWYDIQVWLETYCTSFINHDLTIEGTDSSAVPVFTLATWRAEAGLHADGFERRAVWTTTLHGTMQEGDIIGPWIYTEIEKALVALKWSYKTSNTTWPMQERAGVGDNKASCVDARQASSDDFDADSWVEDAISAIYAEFQYYGTAGVVYSVDSIRHAAYAITTSVPTFATCICAWFFKPTVGFTRDVDGMGIQSGKYWFFEEETVASSDATRQSPDILGKGSIDLKLEDGTARGTFDFEVCPCVAVNGLNCAVDDFGTYAWYLTGGITVLKWVFTYDAMP